MKIGNIQIPYGLFAAPMAGVTDRAFRYMCTKYGAKVTFTEMISAKALCFNDKKTQKLAHIYEQDRPCALQLFGSEPEILSKGASLSLEYFKPDFIDINMGCPAPKIVNNGEGSSLMKKPSLAYEIVKAVVESVGNKIPVTVKMRSGFDKNSINAPEIASLCQRAGASAVFIHGRTRKQMYTPPVDLDVIKAVKQSVSIPVIANGDIKSAKDALSMLEYTGCDGIMIGRASLGNPYIFDEVLCALTGKSYSPPSPLQIKNDVIEHMNLLISDKGEYIGVREARKHIAWYIKGRPGAANLRNQVNLAETKEEIMDLIEKAFTI